MISWQEAMGVSGRFRWRVSLIITVFSLVVSLVCVTLIGYELKQMQLKERTKAAVTAANEVFLPRAILLRNEADLYASAKNKTKSSDYGLFEYRTKEGVILAKSVRTDVRAVQFPERQSPTEVIAIGSVFNAEMGFDVPIFVDWDNGHEPELVGYLRAIQTSDDHIVVMSRVFVVVIGLIITVWILLWMLGRRAGSAMVTGVQEVIEALDDLANQESRPIPRHQGDPIEIQELKDLVRQLQRQQGLTPRRQPNHTGVESRIESIRVDGGER